MDERSERARHRADVARVVAERAMADGVAAALRARDALRWISDRQEAAIAKDDARSRRRSANAMDDR